MVDRSVINLKVVVVLIFDDVAVLEFFQNLVGEMAEPSMPKCVRATATSKFDA